MLARGRGDNVADTLPTSTIGSKKQLILMSLPQRFGALLALDAERLGYRSTPVDDIRELAPLLSGASPDCVLANLDVPSSGDTLTLCRRLCGPLTKIVSITDVACVFRAGEAVRRGASAVLARPTTFGQILAALQAEPRDDMPAMSLDRAIWEFLNQALLEAGSLSGAARRLKLHRTSLKRMLRKRPADSVAAFSHPDHKEV